MHLCIGGGFVLPMSHGHFELLRYIQEQMNSEPSCCVVYIAAVEYCKSLCYLPAV
jgi:hypothetical protein